MWREATEVSDSHNYRMGQALYNVVYDHNETFARVLDDLPDDADPYYEDANIGRFITAIYEWLITW